MKHIPQKGEEKKKQSGENKRLPVVTLVALPVQEVRGGVHHVTCHAQ
jgi:hypothetical protein